MICPKCDAELARHARFCPSCGLSLAADERRRALVAEGAPIVDPLLSAFERDPLVARCPVCLNEHTGTSRRCRRCGGVSLEQRPRSVHESELLEPPLRAFGDRVAGAVPDWPPDLVRVAVIEGLETVRELARELSFMGVSCTLGSDALDPADEAGRVGVYVRRKDAAAAEFVVGGFKPSDPLDAPPAGGASEAWLEEVRGWLELGKYGQVLRLADARAGDPLAEEAAIQALALSGRLREARERARGALDLSAPPLAAAGLRLLLGEVLALGHAGRTFGGGARPEEARVALEEGVRLSPRGLRVSKALMEVLEHLGDREALAREIRRTDRVNPNLFVRDGFFRDLWMRVQ